VVEGTSSRVDWAEGGEEHTSDLIAGLRRVVTFSIHQNLLAHAAVLLPFITTPRK
jgi:hypothetical protein